MKVWLDVANSPHVAFLLPFIKRLESEGSTVIVTARDLGNSLSLLAQRDVRYQRIDGHGGKRLNAKILAFVKRCAALYRFVKSSGAEVAFTQSSFYVPLVARAAGIPSLYTNDNEHASGNLVAMLFASRVFFPEAMRSKVEGGYFRRNVNYYPGVKEGIYLSQDLLAVAEGRRDGQIYFRPEPWLAQYHVPGRERSCEIVRLLLEHGPVTVLPRDASQLEFFEAAFSDRDGFCVSRNVLKLDEIVRSGRLFVGAGGSMSRETAVLGLPTISVYSGPALAVDDYLCNLGFLRRAASLDELRAQLGSLGQECLDQDRGRLVEDGGLAFEMLYRALRELA